MNWTFLLTLYGTAPDGANPLLKHLAAKAKTVLVGSKDESMGYHLFDSDVPDVVAKHEPRPFSYYLFSDSDPDMQSVVNRNTTYFNYLSGQLTEGSNSREIVKHMLNLSAETHQARNYTELLHHRVIRKLHGKFSMVLAQLGALPTFVFSAQKLPLNAWIISYGGMYYLLMSNGLTTADDMEETIIASSDPVRETYFQHTITIPEGSTLALRPVYAITKFRTRIKTYTDKSARKLLIVGYFRRYLQRQCYIEAPNDPSHHS
jgi:hypothetical protein